MKKRILGGTVIGGFIATTLGIVWGTFRNKQTSKERKVEIYEKPSVLEAFTAATREAKKFKNTTTMFLTAPALDNVPNDKDLVGVVEQIRWKDFRPGNLVAIYSKTNSIPEIKRILIVGRREHVVGDNTSKQTHVSHSAVAGKISKIFISSR